MTQKIGRYHVLELNHRIEPQLLLLARFHKFPLKRLELRCGFKWKTTYSCVCKLILYPTECRLSIVCSIIAFKDMAEMQGYKAKEFPIMLEWKKLTIILVVTQHKLIHIQIKLRAFLRSENMNITKLPFKAKKIIF